MKRRLLLFFLMGGCLFSYAMEKQKDEHNKYPVNPEFIKLVREWCQSRVLADQVDGKEGYRIFISDGDTRKSETFFLDFGGNLVFLQCLYKEGKKGRIKYKPYSNDLFSTDYGQALCLIMADDLPYEKIDFYNNAGDVLFSRFGQNGGLFSFHPLGRHLTHAIVMPVTGTPGADEFPDDLRGMALTSISFPSSLNDWVQNNSETMAHILKKMNPEITDDMLIKYRCKHNSYHGLIIHDGTIGSVFKFYNALREYRQTSLSEKLLDAALNAYIEGLKKQNKSEIAVNMFIPAEKLVSQETRLFNQGDIPNRNVSDLRNDEREKLRQSLAIERVLGGDWRSLAGVFDKSTSYVRILEGKYSEPQKRVDALLQQIESEWGNRSREKLITALFQMGRHDLVEVLQSEARRYHP